jgi:lipopolysaccharide export system permease protein
MQKNIMSLLNRYITLEIIKYFFAALLSVLCIFVAIDYLGTMDEFLDAEISLWRAFQFVLYKIPFIITQALPVILLMAILIVFGLMNKHNELILINSSGISIYALVKPVLLVSAVAALTQFYLSDQVVPHTMRQSNAIKYQEIRGVTNISVKQENVWIKGPRRITHIKYFNPASQAIFGFTRYFFDADFRLVRRIDAAKGEYENGKWTLYDAIDQHLDTGNKVFRTDLKDTIDEDLQLHPDDFQRIVLKSEEMNFRELRSYVKKVESEGYDAGVYRTDLYAKSAAPFVCIIMGLVGIGLTAGRRLNRGLPLSITIGICVGFLYWVFQSFCLSLGYAHVLPPLLSAWISNGIFLSAGAVLVINAE